MFIAEVRVHAAATHASRERKSSCGDGFFFFFLSSLRRGGEQIRGCTCRIVLQTERGREREESLIYGDVSAAVVSAVAMI